MHTVHTYIHMYVRMYALIITSLCICRWFKESTRRHYTKYVYLIYVLRMQICDCPSKNQPSSHFQICHFNVLYRESIFTGLVEETN